MNPRSIYIYSFHMPLFFFLSGYVHKDKPFWEFLKSKVKTLYIPYVLFSLASWLYYWTRHIRYERYSLIESHVTKLSSIITGTAYNGGNNPIWFLPCILLVSVAFLLLNQKITKPFVKNLIILKMSLSGYLLSVFIVKMFFYADVAFTGVVFYFLGYFVKQKGYLEYISQLRKGIIYLGILLLGLLHIITAYLNIHIALISRVNMAGNLLGNYFLFYGAALLGIAAFLIISYRIQYIQLLNYCGMNTLVILGAHKPLLLELNTIFLKYMDTGSLIYGIYRQFACYSIIAGYQSICKPY